MSTCKNCIHDDVCDCAIMRDCEETDRCNWFRDKDKFVELPCKVGDTVYFISEGHYYCTNDDCKECECQDDFADKYFDNSCEFVKFGHKIEEHKMRTINDIFHWYSYFGIGAFTTREEAEKRAKELYDINNNPDKESK